MKPRRSRREDQIAGKPELNCDVARGAVKSPLLLWGPYLWADGETPPKADGLIYTREDLSPGDGIHPADSARTKVANLLLNFLKTDPTAKSWFTGKSFAADARQDESHRMETQRVEWLQAR